MSERWSLLAAAAFLVLLVAAYLIYLPGINGTFLLDDGPTLGGLAQVGDLSNTDGVLRYLFTQGTGYLTRPLAKLSFLIDAATFPAPPAGFKHTNILLHLINGLLIIALVLKLMRHLGQRESTAVAVALCTGALWLLHPLNVSTTLYVVQRMTLLATLFMLLGLLAYVGGRAVLPRSPVKGYLLVSAGTGFGTLLAFLCKEIGALLPLYILVLELCIYRTHPAGRGWVLWKSVFLVLPAVFVVGWQLFTYLPAATNYYAGRPFDLSERLLTQSRALVDYLRLIVIPVRTGTGVFHDDFTVSHGLLDPMTTLACALGLLALLSSAVVLWRRAPVYALAVLWFFAGHLLESGLIPLELYFEHRNYLPMLGPVLALVYYAITASIELRRFLRAALAAYIALAAFGTWQNVQVWGSQVVAPITWEREHPRSVRAVQYAMNFWSRLHRYDEALARLDRVAQLQPRWTAPRLERLLVECRSGKPPSAAAVDAVVAQVSDTDWDSATDKVLDELFKELTQRPCETVDLRTLLDITDRLIANPSFRRRAPTMAGLYIQKALVHAELGAPLEEADALRQAYEWNKNWHIAMKESFVRYALGQYDQALEAVARAKRLYTINLKHLRFGYDASEIVPWEGRLEEMQRSARVAKSEDNP